MVAKFDSFFMAGFECSSHRRQDGVRLDLIRATGHDKHVVRDYRQCRELGFRTVRAQGRVELARLELGGLVPVLEGRRAEVLRRLKEVFAPAEPAPQRL